MVKVLVQHKGLIGTYTSQMSNWYSNKEQLCAIIRWVDKDFIIFEDPILFDIPQDRFWKTNHFSRIVWLGISFL